MREGQVDEVMYVPAALALRQRSSIRSTFGTGTELLNNLRLMYLRLPELMDMSIDEVLDACEDILSVERKLQVLHDLGLGYLTLGEETSGLSDGEAQKLKLASEMGKGQSNSAQVPQRLIENGATVIVIEYDLDAIRNAAFLFN